MKTFILVLTILAIGKLATAQESTNDNWIYKIHYADTLICPVDTLPCHTTVFIDMHKRLIKDSTRVRLVIGTEPGASNILERPVLMTRAGYDSTVVSTMPNGHYRFELGSFPDIAPFFIDAIVEHVQ